MLSLGKEMQPSPNSIQVAKTQGSSVTPGRVEEMRHHEGEEEG